MKSRGFANHALMGAICLGGIWLALFLPQLLPALRLGGWPAGLAIATGLIGLLAGPLLLIFVEGDEIFGALGIVAALIAGWGSASVATFLGLSSTMADGARLAGAALGPILLYGSFWLFVKRVQGKSQNQSSSVGTQAGECGFVPTLPPPRRDISTANL